MSQLKLHLTGQRDFALGNRALKIDEDERTVELSFSSEIAGERWGYVEILTHDKGSVRMDRLKNGAALLLNHDRDQQIGVVVEAGIKDKRGIAKVKFSRSPLGEEVFQDVKDGIRTLTSVGYEIHKYEVEERKGDAPVVRATDWEPLEISIVSVPFDATVGVGRTADIGEKIEVVDIPEGGKEAPEGRQETNTMSLTTAAPTTPAQPADNEREAEYQRKLELETRRVSGIAELASRHASIPDMRERSTKAIRENESLEDFCMWVIEQRGGTKVDTNAEIGLSAKETPQFSVRAAILALARRQPMPKFEQECSDAVRAKIRDNDAPENCFYIPAEVARTMVGRRDLTTGSFASAGALVAEDYRAGDMIELLRNLQVLPSIGARYLTGLVGDVIIPRQTGGATAYWLSENGTITESNQTFGQVALTPHRLGAATDFSGQLLAQASLDVEALVRQDLMTVLAIEKDRAALYGTGAAGEPLGLVNQPGIGGVTHGGAATWADLVEFETDVATANALFGNLSWILSPATRGKWRTILRDSVAGADYLYPNDGKPVGYPATVSNQISDNKAFFGNWSDLLIADWTGMRVVVDPYTAARQDLYQVTVQMLTDTNIRRAASFSVSADSAAQ